MSIVNAIDNFLKVNSQAQANAQPEEAQPQAQANAQPQAQPQAQEEYIRVLANALRQGVDISTMPEYDQWKETFIDELAGEVKKQVRIIQDGVSPDAYIVVNYLLGTFATNGVLRHIWHDLPGQLAKLSEDEQAIAAAMLLFRA